MTSPVVPQAISVGEAAIASAINSLPIDIGIVSSAAIAGGNVLADISKNWVVNVHVNRLVKITGGEGIGQTAIIQANLGQSLTIRGTWPIAIGRGSTYMILSVDVAQAIRDALGGGANISAANPLPVDTSPGVKTINQILTLTPLAAAATSVIGDCNSLDLRTGPVDLALTVVATYNAIATLGLRVHVRTSPDDANWDTEDWDVWSAGFTAGATIRETENYVTDPMFLRVLIENLDAGQPITNIAVIASVGV